MERWEVVISLIQVFNCKTVAEIGVCKAQTAEPVLAACKYIERYLMVEPTPHENIVSLVDKYASARFIFGTSEAAAPSIPDRSLDLVFIDALHEYEDVKQDIDLWLPKVKPGGILCGDDYEGKRFPGVKKAVLEVFDESDVQAVQIKVVKVWWTQLPKEW